METEMKKTEDGFKNTRITVKDALMKTPVQHSNPSAEIYKPMLVDKCNKALCTLFIGSTEDINKAAGIDIAHPNFWNRKHRRIQFKERDVDIKFINNNLATSHFREQLCGRLSIIVPCVVAVPATLAALVSLFY